tara:strand:+ start:5459 stop:5692 length:234 start_codon:yes stop_codon:yes gene_type:complete
MAEDSNLELAMMAKVNFENYSKMGPGVSTHPNFVIAKEQLDQLVKRLGAEFYDNHASDCATHNEPAMQNGACDCGAE